MSIFNIITLFGGLAMFLYGMRSMGDALKEGSSGALKKIMEKVTDTPVKSFLLGLIMTAVIQSSTATIVITSGLVGAGIISLHQSLGIIVGANVGTTVTGQIIRLLDLDASGTSFLQFFRPSTLAPLALIIGVVLIMSKAFKSSDNVGRIVIGFGILFSGLLNMTDAVKSLTETGIIENLFSSMGENPLIGYLVGAGVAFVLQSSSASIGILQAFSISGLLSFNEIYAVLVGIYLGDCVTTAIVINIGAKAEARRVGMVNILFNLSKTVLILLAVNLLHRMGLLDALWNRTVYSGDIANTNTVFNLSCAILMMPMLGVYEKLSRKIVRDDGGEAAAARQEETYRKTDVLNPVFLSTPALALNSCYQVLLEMFRLARQNIERAFDVVEAYDEDTVERINADEEIIDLMADKVSNYLVQVSAHITAEDHVEVSSYYYAAVTEFERLGDHAVNLVESAQALHEDDLSFSRYALHELDVLRSLIERILDHTGQTFASCDIVAARHIEPLEEVVDDLVNNLKQNHLERLRRQQCSVLAGTEFLNMLSDIERISDICSNMGTATIARVQPELKHQIHEYVSRLHSGQDETFNREYNEAHDLYFQRLKAERAALAAAE